MPLEPAQIAEVLGWGMAVVSAATLFVLFLRHIDGRPLLKSVPRRPVPWNFLAPLVLLAPTALAVALSTPPHGGGDPKEQVEQTEGDVAKSKPVHEEPDVEAGDVWATGIITLGLAAAAHLALVLIYRATPVDLGFPRMGGEAVKDMLIGATTFVAVILPLFAVQIALVYIFEPVAIHPLMEDVRRLPSLSMKAAAAFAACVAAPIFEETAFRLVFQGWLERREIVGNVLSGTPTEEPAAPVETPSEGLSADESPLADPLVLPNVESPNTVSPTVELNETHWAPILTSAVLFGAAHWGQGVAPASLVILGAALGYVYQRTHRILPCMVCHALFNGFSLVIFFLSDV